jgi:hypothetical protein
MVTVTSLPQPDVWVEENRVRMNSEGRTVKESGPCYGPFIILPSTQVGSYWLCHYATNNDVMYQMEAGIALLKQVGEFLADNFRMAFHQKTKDSILQRLPMWVSHWVKAMKEANKWLDPDPWKLNPNWQKMCSEE